MMPLWHLQKEENRSIAQQSVVLLRSALNIDAKKIQLRDALETLKSIQIREPRHRLSDNWYNIVTA